MRYVNRALHSPSQDWFDKSTLQRPATKPSYFSNLYSDQEVHVALAKLFHRKCAYCEAIDNTTEIEHFRPKSAVDGDPAHDGYYWLAYDWSNLLPACTACNKSLRDLGARPAKGKSTQFPIRAGGVRARVDGDPLDLEQRLLIDPCQDEPSDHLTLLPTGALENLTDMGATSVTVYHLDQSTKEMRRKAALDRLMRAHLKRDVEELEIILSEQAEFCGLLRHYYSKIVARDWREELDAQALAKPPGG